MVEGLENVGALLAKTLKVTSAPSLTRKVLKLVLAINQESAQGL
jgi:hypothetical protein